jgi:hypothetical protein
MASTSVGAGLPGAARRLARARLDDHRCSPSGFAVESGPAGAGSCAQTALLRSPEIPGHRAHRDGSEIHGFRQILRHAIADDTFPNMNAHFAQPSTASRLNSARVYHEFTSPASGEPQAAVPTRRTRSTRPLRSPTPARRSRPTTTCSRLEVESAVALHAAGRRWHASRLSAIGRVVPCLALVH